MGDADNVSAWIGMSDLGQGFGNLAWKRASALMSAHTSQSPGSGVKLAQ